MPSLERWPRQFTVRASMAADVVLSVGVPQAEGIGQKLKTAGFQTELVRGDFDDPIPALLKVIDQHGNRVDLLIGLKGLEPQASRGRLLLHSKEAR